MNNLNVEKIYLNCDINYECIATWIKKNSFIFPNTNNDSLRTIYHGLQKLPWPILIVTAKKIWLFTGLTGWQMGFGTLKHKYVVDEEGWLCESIANNRSVPGKRFCKLDDVTIKNEKICIPKAQISIGGIKNGKTSKIKMNSKT